jgi:acyl-CoA synthetase (NDP forming)
MNKTSRNLVIGGIIAVILVVILSTPEGEEAMFANRIAIISILAALGLTAIIVLFGRRKGGSN